MLESSGLNRRSLGGDNGALLDAGKGSMLIKTRSRRRCILMLYR